MKRLNNKKGFTLAELLVVVAIIAVLVAISIPVFTSQLEKAREASDAANLRALYAETAVKALEADGAKTDSSEGVVLTQTEDNWKYVTDIAGVKTTEIPYEGTVYCHIAADGSVTFNTEK